MGIDLTCWMEKTYLVVDETDGSYGGSVRVVHLTGHSEFTITNDNGDAVRIHASFAPVLGDVLAAIGRDND